MQSSVALSSETIGEAIDHIESTPRERHHAAELYIFNQLLQGRNEHEEAIAELVTPATEGSSLLKGRRLCHLNG